MKNKKFWNWKNQTSPPDADECTERVLEIYGTIAEESWFEDDVKAAVINKPDVQADTTPADEVGTPIKNLDKRLSLLK